MIYDIGEILKNCIGDENLPYIETLAGLVQQESVQKLKSKNELVKKSFPIYCPIKGACSPNNVEPLIPNKNRKSLFYVQDNGGVFFSGKGPGYSTFTADLWLVGWLNPKKLGSDECSISAPIIAQLLKIINKKTFNGPNGIYSRIKFRPSRILTKEPIIFSKWGYSDKFYHNIEWPYDYFAIQIFVDFAVGDSCIENFIVNPEIKC